jgi:tetratricopeptide (TPR) repeat protein
MTSPTSLIETKLKFIPLSKNKAEHADLLLEKGMRLHRAKQVKQAEQIYREILKQIPNHADAAHLLAIILVKKDPHQALKLMEIALDRYPTVAVYYSDRGLIYKHLNQFNQARKDFQRAIFIDPNLMKAYYQLGNILIKLEQYETAIAIYQKILKKNPEDISVYHHLGQAYSANRNFQETINCYEKFIQTYPQQAKAYAALGNAFNNINQLIQAEEYIKKALELEPDQPEFCSQLGKNYKDQGKIKEALFYINKAVSLKPNSVSLQYNRAFLLLELGEYLEGWEKYEYRFKMQKQEKTYRRFSKPLWKGENFSEKTLFIHAEQGLGDTLQFIRYLPFIADRGGKIIFECQPTLMSILEPLQKELKFDQIISTQEEKPDFDYHVALLSSPHIFKTTLETIPAPKGYITAPLKENFKTVIPAHTPHPKVGIVWAGNKQYKGDHKRSIPFKYIETLLEQHNHIHFYSLQYGERSKDIQEHGCDQLITDLSGYIQDFTDTASLIQQLDLLITSDTSIAHLSGAMGKTTWVLLSFSPDFRWLLNRSDSPWYKSARLFRQADPGDWTSVMEQVIQALKHVKIRP